MAETDFSALSKLFGQGAPKKAAPSVPAAPVASKYAGAFDRLVAQGKVKPEGGKPEESSFLGDVWSGLGGGLLTALNWADKPRAAVVSAFKEAADAGLGQYGGLGLGGLLLGKPPEGAEASWSDFTKQIGENIGTGEVIEEYRPNAPHWAKVAGGIAGDVIFDPLTWLTMGVGTAAKKAAGTVARTAAEQVADDALRLAVKEGSSKGIARALTKSAETAGFAMKEGGGFADDAVNRLIVEASKRGNGALTKQGLLRAGIADDVAQRLGLSGLERTFYGKVVPGSKLWAETAEGVKGGIKAKLRTTETAQFLRGKFLPKNTKDLYRVVFDESSTLGQKAAATIAAAATEAPVRLARTWRGQTMRALIQDFDGAVRDVAGAVDKQATELARKQGVPAWSKLAKDSAINATHSLEAGKQGVLEDVARRWLRKIWEDANRFGVKLGDLGDNYVPHVVTEDARQLARKNPEVKAIFESLRDEQGFQKFRELRANSPFLGTKLQEGTIEEINRLFAAKFGKKLFEDNLQDILPRYVRSVEAAIQRAQLVGELQRLGMVTSQIDTIVRKLNPDQSWQQEVARLRATRDALVGAQQVQLAEGFTIRRDALAKARKIYTDKAIATRANLRAAMDEFKKLEAVYIRAEKKLFDFKASRKLETANADAAAALDRMIKAADDPYVQADIKRLEAGRAKRRAKTVRGGQEDYRRELTKDITVLKKELGKDAEEVIALVDQRNEVVKKMATLKAEIAAFKAEEHSQARILMGISRETLNTLRATARESRTRYRSAAKMVKFLSEKARTLEDEVALAHSAQWQWLNDNATAVSSLRRDMVEAEIEAAKYTALPSLPKSGRATLNLMNEIRTRMQTLVQVLSDPNVAPELQALAKLEAVAQQSDMAAAWQGRGIEALDSMIKATADKRFINEVKKRTQAGMVAAGEELQMPEWLFDAMTVDHVLGDISRMPKTLQKYVALFKGYATLRPGFHVRNAYTALFNMYLEGGVENFKYIKQWHQFYEMVDKNPENYMDAAVRKFGAERAANMDQALQVMYGSGAGQVESVNALTSLRKGSINPLDPNNKLFRLSRDAGSWVEDHVRGAHALAVLERTGGNVDMAQQIVNKWHFNYSDIGSWDQGAKNIMPFWTFFSRNLALQAQTYVRNIPRYNRLVSNFERNITKDEDDPEVVPQYFSRQAGIRLTGGKEPLYLFTDLPMAVFPNQVDQFTSLSRFPELLSQTSPIIKAPLEGLMGKSLYTDIPIADKYVPVPQGLRQLVSAIGGDLPTDVFRQGSDGTPMMQASWANALKSLVPTLGQTERLFPSSEKTASGMKGGAKDNALSALSWFAGVGIRPLDQRAQQAEMARRYYDALDAAKREASLRRGGA